MSPGARLQVLRLVIIGWLSAVLAQEAAKVRVNWDKTTVVSKSTPTLQVVVNPPLRPREPLGIAAYKAVKELGADYVRYVPRLPYPRLAVAELEPATQRKTSWDFSLIDPMTKDFLAATEGHPTVMNFSTIPAWLFKNDKPVTYPDDPNKPVWNYTQGTQEHDPTDKEIADYYARLVSWYVDGGFTDENGVRHESGDRYKFSAWEVLNEIEAEHHTTPEQYTRGYDAIVSVIHEVSLETQFMGLALARLSQEPRYFEYFLDPKNHRPGIPLDYISYHFYATPAPTEGVNEWQYTLFDQANGFLNTVRFVEEIRKRLSPSTKTDLDELGTILPTDNQPGDNVPPTAAYWNLCGSRYAYLYIELSKVQIDLIGMSQLAGYPTQFPSVSMMDWTKNQPNARYWTLKLIKDSFRAGDKLVETSIQSRDVAAQGFVGDDGRKLLLANMRNHAVDLELPDAEKASALTVERAAMDRRAA